MMRMLRKTASSMEKSVGSIPDDFDLSTWEFVNASQSDDEDLYSFDSDDVVSESDGFIGAGDPESEPGRDENEGACAPRGFVSAGDVIAIQSLSVSPPMTLPVEMTFNDHVYHGDADLHNDDDVHDVDTDDDDNYGYDDELLPWILKDKFGKQRIKKLGKRGGSKLSKSKRMPFHYNRPGCLYGKHGYGVQHSFI